MEINNKNLIIKHRKHLALDLLYQYNSSIFIVKRSETE